MKPFRIVLLTILTAVIFCPSALFAALITQNIDLINTSGSGVSQSFRYDNVKVKEISRDLRSTGSFIGFDTSLGTLDRAWIEFSISLKNSFEAEVRDDDFLSYAHAQIHLYHPGFSLSFGNMIISEFHKPQSQTAYTYGEDTAGPRTGSQVRLFVDTDYATSAGTAVPFNTKEWATFMDEFEVTLHIWDTLSSVHAPEDDDYLISYEHWMHYRQGIVSVYYEYTPHSETSSTPLPASLLLFGAGICGLARFRRKEIEQLKSGSKF